MKITDPRPESGSVNDYKSELIQLKEGAKSLDQLSAKTRALLEQYGCIAEDGTLNYELRVSEELPDYPFFVDSRSDLVIEDGEQRVYQWQEEARDLRDTIKETGQAYDVAIDAFSGGGHSLIPVVFEGLAKQGAAIDVNPRAVNLASLNAEVNGVASQVSFKQGDIRNGFPKLPDKRVVYMANPPFALKAKGVELESMRDGGENGLELTAAFINSALEAAKPGDAICGVAYSRINSDASVVEAEQLIQRLLAKHGKTSARVSISIIEGAKLWRGANGRKEQDNPMSVDMTYVKGKNQEEEGQYRETAELYKQQGWDQIGYFRYSVEL